MQTNIHFLFLFLICINCVEIFDYNKKKELEQSKMNDDEDD